MPRIGRVIVPGCPHHIVQRGHNRRAVFVDESDYQYYIDNLKECRRELGIKVYAYCLMTNHIHLIVDPGSDPNRISRLMKILAGRQTGYVNRLERRRGTLWEGRYKISAIDCDAYLLQCCRYVELNPVTAKMVAKAEDYRWSSYIDKVTRGSSPWFDFDPCYLSLVNPAMAYRQFVESGISEQEYRFIQEVVARNQLTGHGLFVDEIEKRLGIRLLHRKPDRPKP